MRKSLIFVCSFLAVALVGCGSLMNSISDKVPCDNPYPMTKKLNVLNEKFSIAYGEWKQKVEEEGLAEQGYMGFVSLNDVHGDMVSDNELAQCVESKDPTERKTCGQNKYYISLIPASQFDTPGNRAGVAPNTRFFPFAMYDGSCDKLFFFNNPEYDMKYMLGLTLDIVDHCEVITSASTNPCDIQAKAQVLNFASNFGEVMHDASTSLPKMIAFVMDQMKFDELTKSTNPCER